MIIAGIDPGLTGAIVLLDSADPLFLRGFDMPILTLPRGGKSKREIDVHMLVRMLRNTKIAHAFIEQAGARPGQGVTSMFAFGKSFGIIVGILAALNIPTTFVPPRHWKTTLQVPAAKAGARARASQLLPHAADRWARAKDDGRAEAAILAYFGQRELNRTAAAAE